MKPTSHLYLIGLFLILALAGGCSKGGEDIPTPPPAPTPTPPIEKDYITVNKDSLEVTCQGEDIQISFMTNHDWTASSNQSWCTLATTSGEKGNVALKATLVENTTFEKRMATITLKAGTASQKVVITQEAAEPDKLELVATSFTVTAEGKDIQIPFVTDVAWEASADQDWCTLSATSGEAGNQSIIAKIAKNKVQSERKVVITFKAGTATPQIVTIAQEAAPPDEIEIKETSFQVGTEGKDIEISFTTNAAWMIASNQSWCTLSNSVGEEGTYTLTVTVDKNTSYEDRIATITLKAGEVQETITVSQERKYQLKVTYEDTFIDYAGANVTVKIQCNTKYEMSFQADWLRQVKSRSMNEETLIFEVDRNDADKEREAEIIFFNQEKNLRETIKIRQEAKPEDTSVTPSGNIGNMIWG